MKTNLTVLIAVIIFCQARTVIAQILQLEVRETGYMTDEWNTWLVNPGPIAISFDGYTISDGLERLNIAGWRSVESVVLSGITTNVIGIFGPGALAFGSANPGPGNLTELTLGAGATMQPGAEWSFGPIIDPGSAPEYPGVDDEMAFEYSTLDAGQPPAQVVEGPILVVPGVPEPSTLVLGVCGVLFGLAFLNRRHGSSGRSP